MQQRPTIAIIGSGPTGIYCAHYLLQLEQKLSVTIFESQAEAGKGMPYHQNWNDKQMLSNIASIELPPVTQTLVDWLQQLTDEQLARLGVLREEINDRAFLPRVALGDYFRDELKAIAQSAPHEGNELDIKTCHEVKDVRVDTKGIKLTVRENNRLTYDVYFDYVIMATGHVWPKNPEIWPGYFLSPWPIPALKTISHCHVGIRGTSLSGIDAVVALSVARGSFVRDTQGVLRYLAEPGTEAFHATMISRKGLLPEADFYYPIPYEPLEIFNNESVQALIASSQPTQLLDKVYDLFKAELMACDPDYGTKINLQQLALEQFLTAYFAERETYDPFVWAEQNLAEAKENQVKKHTVPWRYAILRMHEVIKVIVPKLTVTEYKRFNQYFKPVFVDDYATVPHESIERLIALHRAGKLHILGVGEEYTVDTAPVEGGATLVYKDASLHFDAFIEATGQRPLSVHEFPFPSLWEQGIVHSATAPHFVYSALGQRINTPVEIGGVALDAAYHPLSNSPYAQRLYCLSLPFMLSLFPFAQGITSSHEMGKEVAEDMKKHFDAAILAIDGATTKACA